MSKKNRCPAEFRSFQLVVSVYLQASLSFLFRQTLLVGFKGMVGIRRGDRPAVFACVDCFLICRIIESASTGTTLSRMIGFVPSITTRDRYRHFVTATLQALKKNRCDLGWLFVDIYSGYPRIGRSECFLKLAGDFMCFFYAKFRLETTLKSQVYALASFADADS